MRSPAVVVRPRAHLLLLNVRVCVDALDDPSRGEECEALVSIGMFRDFASLEVWKRSFLESAAHYDVRVLLAWRRDISVFLRRRCDVDVNGLGGLPFDAASEMHALVAEKELSRIGRQLARRSAVFR